MLKTLTKKVCESLLVCCILFVTGGVFNYATAQTCPDVLDVSTGTSVTDLVDQSGSKFTFKPVQVGGGPCNCSGGDNCAIITIDPADFDFPDGCQTANVAGTAANGGWQYMVAGQCPGTEVSNGEVLNIKVDVSSGLGFITICKQASGEVKIDDFSVEGCCPEMCMSDDPCATSEFDFETCSCISTPAPEPNCDDGDCTTEDSFNTATCACENIKQDEPDCDDKDCTTVDSYNTATCACENIKQDEPDCDDKDCATKDFYDTATCNCVNEKLPEAVCKTGEEYNSEMCMCVPVACKLICDKEYCENGAIYKEILDTDKCECVKVQVAKPTCKTDEIYNNATCACEPKACDKVCDKTPVCDGTGLLMAEELNEETCECEKIVVKAPECQTGEKYDISTCTCEAEAPTCSIQAATLQGGPFTFCVGDGKADFIAADAIVVSNKRSGRVQWVITDDKGVILGLPNMPSDVDFDKSGVGTCLIWHLTYEAGLVGAEVGLNATNLKGCYDLSNALTVERNDCTPEPDPDPTPTCSVRPATLEGGPFTFCAGDGEADFIAKDAITLTGKGSGNAQWVITDDKGEILGLPGAPSDVDFDKAGVGTCLIWYLEYEDGLKGATIGLSANDLEGCYALSNPLAVERQDCTPEPEPETKDPNCDDITFTTKNGTVSVTNLTAPIEIVKVYNENWKLVYECVAKCNDTEAIPLAKGNYIITVQLFTTSWQSICNTKEYITVGETIIDDTTDAPTDDKTDTPTDTPTDDTTGDTGNTQSSKCGDVTITYGNGTINMSGQKGGQYYFKVLQRFGQWQYALNCTSKCGDEVNLTNLKTGGYDITIYNSDWSLACATTTIDLKGGLLSYENSGSRTAQTNVQFNTTTNVQHAIYPNPATQELFVDMKAYAGQKGDVSLINQFGQIIQQIDFDEIPTSTIRFDLQKVETGLHFLTIKLESNKVITEKVLINK